MHSKNCIAADQRSFVQVVRVPPERDARLLLRHPILDFHVLDSGDSNCFFDHLKGLIRQEKGGAFLLVPRTVL